MAFMKAIFTTIIGAALLLSFNANAQDTTNEVSSNRSVKKLGYALRAGVRVGGDGDASTDFSGPNAPGDTKAEYDDTSGPILFAGDLLYTIPMTRRMMVRVGGTLQLLSTSEISFSEDDQVEAGVETHLLGFAEVLHPVSQKIGVFVRVFGGLVVLFPGGDLQQQIDSAENACAGVSNCDVAGGPFFGPTLGLSFGGLYSLGQRVKLRTELMFQHITIDTFSIEANGVEQTVNTTGHRYFLMAGVEL